MKRKVKEMFKVHNEMLSLNGNDINDNNLLVQNKNDKNKQYF